MFSALSYRNFSKFRSRRIEKQVFFACTRSQGSRSSNLPCPGSSTRLEDASSSVDHSARSNEDFSVKEESLLVKCAEGRRRVNNVWSQMLNSQHVHEKNHQSLIHSICDLIDSLQLDPGRPIEKDISKGLGESLDRLLILTVKASGWCLQERARGNDQNMVSVSLSTALPKLLGCVSRNGIALDIKTIQHMFSSCYNYAQALTIFEEIKLSGMTMDAGVYYSMIYCLQKLDEESWGRTLHLERMTTQRTSNAALKFVLHGPDSQLLPENKPHIGRVMYADVHQVFPHGKSYDYDASGKEWDQRYRKK